PAGAGEVDGEVKDAGVENVQSRNDTIRSLKRTLYRAARNVRHPRRLVEARKIRAEVADFLGGRDVLAAYEREVRASGLLEHLIEKGRAQDKLPPLLERLGTIGSFMHDSEHSFDCMWFEFNEAWPHLRAGGVLLSDDVNSTKAFPRFAGEQSRTPVRLARGMALLPK